MRHLLSTASILSLLISVAAAQSLVVPIPPYTYGYINGDGTVTLKTGPGLLHTICVNTATATETITAYDSLAGSGTAIGAITVFASKPGCYRYDINFTIGLTVVTGAAVGDVTVSYK